VFLIFIDELGDILVSFGIIVKVFADDVGEGCIECTAHMHTLDSISIAIHKICSGSQKLKL